MMQFLDLRYHIKPIDLAAHLFAVELEIPRPLSAELTLTLPAWIPGSYMIRDFARHIVSLSVEGGDRASLRKLDKQTWRLTGVDGAVTVRYQVYAWELTVRSAHLDTTHGYFNGPSVFLRVEGLEQSPCGLELLPPDLQCANDWRVATSLQVVSIEEHGFGLYQADDYEDLIDHPVEMGRFTELEFGVQGISHRLAITGRHRADQDRLSRDLQRICEQHASLFGELPIDRYLFLTTAVGDGYGGLEHRYSTSLLCCRDDLTNAGEEKPAAGYRRFLGLCSHEYFHLWNVKRIRPEVFIGNGLEREVHTRLLWAFEGITSYYDDLALVRSGCIDASSYLELLAETITRVQRNPGRLNQTLAESSFDAWTKFYKQDENAPNAIVSYYAKGALAALALDLTIRHDTNDQVSLDDVMRALWQRHGKPGIGVSERGVEAVVADVTGLDLSGFFGRVLDSTDELDLAPLLDMVGIELRLRPSKGSKDLGGVADRFAVVSPEPSIGVRLRDGGPGAVLAVVLSGSPAEQAGLSAGDTLVAIDGIRVGPDNFQRLVNAAAAAEVLHIHAFRRDELMEFLVHPRPAPADTCELRIVPEPSAGVSARRRNWLGLPE